MPATNLGEVFRRGNADQKNCADKISQQRHGNSERNERHAAEYRQSFQFAEEQPDRERRLQRTNAAARFVYADEAVANADQIAFDLRGSPK